jgi:predicted small metal-binding protein
VQTGIEKLGFHCAKEIWGNGDAELIKEIKTLLKNN